MKTVFKYFAIAAAAVATLVSCNKEIGTVDPVQNQEGIVLKFASDRPALIDANTKTVYNNGTIEWSTGDKIKVGITVGGVWMAADGAPSEGKTPKFYVSDELQEGASTFTVSNYFTLQETGTYKFYGLYPSSASSSSDIGGAPSVSVTIPATQTPAANSFDNAADLMIAVSEDYDGIPQDRTIDLDWTRLVAHGDITLKNLPAFSNGENVRSIEFSIQSGGDMVGQHYVDLTSGAISLPNNATAKNAVTVKADNLSVSGGQLEFWFTSLPFTATSIKIVLTTNLKIYTKEYTNISKTFMVNKRNTLGISMSNAAVENNEQVIEDGDYVIAYVGEEESYMMLSDNLVQATGPSTFFRAAASLPTLSADNKMHVDANAAWRIEYDSNSATYTIQSLATEQFLKGKGDDTSLTMGTPGAGFTGAYTDETKTTVKFIVTTGDKTRGIGFNTSTTPVRWGMYQGSAAQPISLTLYPAVATLKCATPTFSPEAGAVTEGTTVNISCATDEATIYYTTDGSTPTTSSTSGNSVVINSATTIKAIAVKEDYENSDVAEASYTIGAGIQTVTISEFLNKPVNQTDWYQLTGVITGIASTTYGNFTMEDASGSVYVYGLTATEQETNDKSFSSLGLQVGYTVTIITHRAEHNGTAQAGGNIPAYYVSHIVPPSLVVSPTSLVFDAAGESKTVEATADNFDGSVSITASSDNAHFTTSVSGTTITVIAAANQGSSSISGTITVTATDGTATKTATVNVSQNAASITPANDGDILWQEDFTGYGTSMPTTATGTHVYGGGTVTYSLTNGGSTTKLYEESSAGGTSPELLISKANGTYSISGIPTGNATTMTLTFKSNYGDRCVISSSTSGITVGTPSIVNGIVTTSISATSGVTSFDLTITNTNSSNVRVDNFELVVGVPPVTLSSIAVSGQTTSFTQGATFSFGGTVTATYSDGSTADVTSSATFSGYNMSTTGSQTVSVSYTENGVERTTTYTINVSAAGGGTSTLTFTAKCNGTGTADDNVSWTVSSDGTESNFDSDRGIHYGTNKAAVKYIKLNTSGISGTITKVVVNASAASTATVGVTVGGSTFGGNPQSLTNSAANYTFTGSASGEIVVTVTKPSSANKALYVKSIAVTYTN